jgi:EAL and modified HD-GYP domain-containing signal transduction protein
VDVFVARQAIFDRTLKIYGYELLFRSRLTDSYDGHDDALATLQVIANSFLTIGASKVLGGGQAFINCPQSLLSDERIEMLPRSTTVIEILESIKPEPEAIAACRQLKDLGFRLALDDFTGQDGYEGFIELADFIKVDFRAVTIAARASICSKYGKRGIRMLAEKVETRKEFQEALDFGYDYYQGHFFARPSITTGREITGYKLNYLNILKEIHQPEIDHRHITELIQFEVSLTHRLLRFVNSAAFERSSRVKSIREAVTLLGDDGIRKWVWLAALPELASNKPGELIVSAAVRARFCELIAPLARLASRESDLFLMGMLSLLDAMLDRPLAELLAELNLAGDMQEGLLSLESPDNGVASVYSMVRAYEAADWTTLDTCAERLRIPREQLPDLYLQSTVWAEGMFRSQDHTS